MPPFDVYDLGRMAVIQDPTGATISMWQAKKHIGVGVTKELNAFGWSELATRDTAAAEKFYTGLFGWGTFVSDTVGFKYTHWRVDGIDVGGMMAMDANWPANVPPHWMNYASVENCDASAKKVTELGGGVCVPPTDIPEVGRFAVVNDPQGATFSIIQLTNPKL
jgi:predicted enzyme related to lactoylglutathione lyase